MDGDVAPLRGICDLAEQYGAMVFIDECHATGFLGPRGRYVGGFKHFIWDCVLKRLKLMLTMMCRGTDELLGVMDRVHIVNSTLGKALGGAAGKTEMGLIICQSEQFKLM